MNGRLTKQYSLVSRLILLFFLLIGVGSVYSQDIGVPAYDNSLLDDQRQKIHEQYNYLLEEDRFTDHLDLEETIDFPIGIRKKIGNIDYIIAIDSIVITPQFAFLNASMSLGIPQSDERIAFRGTDIKFTHDGGLAPGARLELVGNYRIATPGRKVDLLLKETDTYVEWDCDGFKSFGINGGLAFSRELVEPIDANRQVVDGEVQASFKVTAGGWNDIIASASITPFQVKGLDGVSFFVDNVVVDFSDIQNPPGIYLSPAFATTFLPYNRVEIWRGAYFRGVEILLPDQFNSSAGSPRKITGKDIWIDEYGLSGDFSAKNLAMLNATESASMQGWPFSINEFDVSILANRLQKASFSGEINLPIANENTQLAYQAYVDQSNRYFFSISPTDDLEFDIWKAGNVQIDEASFIKVDVVNGKFYPTASLNGKMSIGIEEPNSPKLHLPNIAFEQLKISGNAPFISGGSFFPDLNSNANHDLAGFSLDLEKIGLQPIGDRQIALSITSGIILTGESGGDFAATGSFKILSNYESAGGSPKWKFEKITLEAFKIDLDNGACSFKGDIVHFNNDPTYGSGFRGMVDANFKPGIGVKAKATFGKIKDYKYWYVDALASFSKGIPISAGLGIYGFGGGASYHMKRENLGLGELTNSGIRYVPDVGAGLSVKAAVKIGTTPNPKAFNGNASFEIAFYDQGGIKNLNFKGEGNFMSLPIEENTDVLQDNLKSIIAYKSNYLQPEGLLVNTSTSSNAAVSGHLDINYDFSNRILHGNIEVFINTAGGIVQGTGNQGRAGWAVLHFEPSTWYIHIGNPDNRIGVRMGIGKIVAKTDAYFMVGDNIPASPPPDKNVSRILGGIDLNYMRDENALGNGTGFAVGAALSFDTGDLRFWKFYARFMAGAGFDLMLKNYGSQTTCNNRSEVIGINGWYANGQAYAYFEGDIGIIVDLFGKTRKVEIINLGAAAVLQAKLPNPVWMRGVVGGRFSALGGLISGNCKFEVTLGEECDLDGTSAISGLEIIAEITPGSSEDEVNVFTNPQAVFNLPVNKEFELTNAENKVEIYRIRLDHFRARDQYNPLEATIDWNAAQDVAILKTTEVLTPKESIKVEVQISYEKKTGETWLPVTSNGNIIVENRAVEFKTGTAPDFIPNSNIAVAYPVLGMKNYFPREREQGYLQLIKGQDYLFETDDVWEQKARVGTRGAEVDFEIKYIKSTNRVEYQLPVLQNSTAYDFQIVNVPKSLTKNIDKNVATKTNIIDNSQDINIRTQGAEGSIINFEEILLFKNNFRSSRYGTFIEKMQGTTVARTNRPMLAAWDLFQLVTILNIDEEFSEEEISGSPSTSARPLLELMANLDNNYYFNNLIGPLVYANYPIDGTVKITTRNTDELGIVPKLGVNLTSNGRVYYDLPIYYRNDFEEIRSKVIPRYLHQPSPLPEQIKGLLFYSFPIIPKGEYKVDLHYYLPGESEPNSSFPLNINLDF